jgi:hypothetical protein
MSRSPNVSVCNIAILFSKFYVLAPLLNIDDFVFFFLWLVEHLLVSDFAGGAFGFMRGVSIDSSAFQSYRAGIFSTYQYFQCYCGPTFAQVR